MPTPPTPAVEQVAYAQITRIDEGKREVTLTATSEAVDSFKTRFDYNASKNAFARWWGNVREMHAGKAVGNRVAVQYDDAQRQIAVTLRVSKGAQDTWEKVLDGTLKGASIGAANVVWEKPIARAAGEDPIPVATYYDLVELSLVDHPSNPECRISAIRAQQPDLALLDEMPTDAPASVAIAPFASSDSAPAVPQGTDVNTAVRLAMGELTRALAPSAATTMSASPITTGTSMHGVPQPHNPQRAAKAERAAVVQHIGDRAAASVPAWNGQENYAVYLARVASVRGAAEQEALRAYDTEMTRRMAVASIPQEGHMPERTPAPATAQRAIPKAISGSSVFDGAKPSNPITTVQPKHVGQREIINTEDPAATDFGVPNPDAGRPTPGDDDGDRLTFPEDQFHDGGHQQEADWDEGTYDSDGDDDGDEADKPMISSRPPTPTTITAGPRTPDMPKGQRAAQPDEASAFGEYATLLTEFRTALADETRGGKRVSAASRADLHHIRDGAIGVARQTAEHCGCADCVTHPVLTQTQDAEDEDEYDEGGERLATASVERAMATLTEQMTTQFDSAMQKLYRSLDKRMRIIEQPDADTSRAVAAETVRALDATRQAVEAVASSVGGLEARLEQIENQPQTGGPMGPGAFVAEKRVALHAEPPRGVDLAEVIRSAATSTDSRTQLDAFGQIWAAQQAQEQRMVPPIPQFGARPAPRTR